MVTFLILLPCAVWFLGSLLGLLDHSDRIATLRRIAWRGLPFVGAALLLGSRATWPSVAALFTALAVHVAAFAGTRAATRLGWLTGSDTDAWDD